MFLVTLHAAWIFVPAYAVFAQVRDLRGGIEVEASYAQSQPLLSDTKLDYEKSYRHVYSFRHPTSGDTVSYETIAVGRDNHGTSMILKFNPKTGAVGPTETWAVVASNLRLVGWSVGGLVWSTVLFGGFFGLFRRRRRRSRSRPRSAEKPSGHVPH